MLLTLTGKIPAHDLGYLLHKNPARVHTFPLSFGNAHVFYPQVSDTSGTAALLLDVDPVSLVRGRKARWGDFALAHYVNDRPYASTSFLSVALSRVFGTAMGGRSKERPELAQRPVAWRVTVHAVPCRSGPELITRLFEPLGYQVEVETHPLDSNFPEWGAGIYHSVTLSGETVLSQLLTHLYVLVPVLDVDKHYWIDTAEVEKLLAKGEGWLADHPEKELIAKRYLGFHRTLTDAALSRLRDDETPPPEEPVPHRLHDQRLDAVMHVLREAEAASVIDLGCGEGRLLRRLIAEAQFKRIAGMDVASRALELAEKRLELGRLTTARRESIQLFQGSLLYRDARLAGYDAAVVSEVIEHFDPPRLSAFERVVFGFARPGVVILTTPNAEYNIRYAGLDPGHYRHSDHRFEWTREEFARWAGRVASGHGYQVHFEGVGPEDAEVGAPTQMAVFKR